MKGQVGVKVSLSQLILPEFIERYFHQIFTFFKLSILLVAGQCDPLSLGFVLFLNASLSPIPLFCYFNFSD